ncbi:uncharacterized protein [Taeniopygia guttata]|uniref:uncharacterized protein n=1 Tax=Taeniopygia guttata TaxID=59729 RepID=UPI003BB95AB5
MAARLRLRRGPRRPPPPPARGLLRRAGARAALPAPLTLPSAASSPPHRRRNGRGAAEWRGAALPSAPRRPLCPVQRGPARPPPLPTAPPPLCRGEEEEAPLQRPAVHVRHFQPASAAGASGGRGRAGGAGSEPAASSAPLREGLRAPLQSRAHGQAAGPQGSCGDGALPPAVASAAFPAGTAGKPLGGVTALGCRGRPVVAGQVANLRVACDPSSELPLWGVGLPQVFQSENRGLQHKAQCFIAPQSQKDLFILHLICASCLSVIMIQHGDMLKDH